MAATERVWDTRPGLAQRAAVASMLINVRVTPNARRPGVVKVDESTYEVKVDERATGGAANKRLLEILSKHFGVPKSKVAIVRGARSRDKVLEVAV